MIKVDLTPEQRQEVRALLAVAIESRTAQDMALNKDLLGVEINDFAGLIGDYSFGHQPGDKMEDDLVEQVFEDAEEAK